MTVPNLLLTEQAVNLGDHAQDLTRAVAYVEGETIEALIERALTRKKWDGEREPLVDAYLTIRIPTRDGAR